MTLLSPSSRLSTTSNSQSPPSRIPRSPALYHLPPRPRTTIFSSPKARPKIPGVTSNSKPKPKPKAEPRLRSLVLVEKYHPPPSESESKPPFRVTALREGKGKENGGRIPRTTRLPAPLPPLKQSPLKPKLSPLKPIKASLKPSVAKSVSVIKPATIRIKAKVHRPRSNTTGMKGLSMSMRKNKGKRPSLVIPPAEANKVEQEPVDKVAESTADRSPSPARSLSVSTESPALSPSLSSPSSSVFPTASQPSSPITTEFIASDFNLSGSPTSPSIVSSPPTSTSLASLHDTNAAPRPPRRKIIIPPFLDTQSGPKDAKIRGELERLRAKKKVQSAAADVSLIQ
ncbi:hypothetical protein BDZ89DRAFT_1062378 [Hymenopellis radicata]|nr:hypothetical protein BDZ89DRAFT_1062378 [Hymenopellis radicata]